MATVLETALIKYANTAKRFSIGDQIINNALVKSAGGQKNKVPPVKDDSNDKEKSNDTYSNMDKPKPAEKPDYSTNDNTDENGVPRFKTIENKQNKPEKSVAGTDTPENKDRKDRNAEGITTFDANTEKNNQYDRDILKQTTKDDQELKDRRASMDTTEAVHAYGAGTLGGGALGAAIGAGVSGKKNRTRNALIGGGIGAATGALATGAYRNRVPLREALKKIIG